MPAVKRKSEDSVSTLVKRARVGTLDASFAKAKLEELSKDELIERVMALEEELAAIPRPKVLSEAELDEKVEKTRKMMVSGIQKQMKWTPSCKTSSAKFAYEGNASNKDILLKLFSLPKDYKKKMLQMSIQEFEGDVARDTVESSARYSYLRLTGEHVNIRLAPEGTFKISGSYGV